MDFNNVKYKYRKVKPEDIEIMKKLRDKGLTYFKISLEFDVSPSTVQYYLSPGTKEGCILRARKFYKKMNKEEIKEKSKKRYDYLKKYMKERYHNDEKFRKKMIESVVNCEKNRVKRRKENGECANCGIKLDNKKYFTCEKCREKYKTK